MLTHLHVKSSTDISFLILDEDQTTKSQIPMHDLVPDVPQRTLHQPDEPVRGHKYDIYLDEPPPIPARKVVTGCRVPSYRGRFC